MTDVNIIASCAMVIKYAIQERFNERLKDAKIFKNFRECKDFPNLFNPGYFKNDPVTFRNN